MILSTVNVKKICAKTIRGQLKIFFLLEFIFVGVCPYSVLRVLAIQRHVFQFSCILHVLQKRKLHRHKFIYISVLVHVFQFKYKYFSQTSRAGVKQICEFQLNC